MARHIIQHPVYEDKERESPAYGSCVWYFNEYHAENGHVFDIDDAHQGEDALYVISDNKRLSLYGRWSPYRRFVMICSFVMWCVMMAVGVRSVIPGWIVLVVGCVSAYGLLSEAAFIHSGSRRRLPRRLRLGAVTVGLWCCDSVVL